MTWATRSDPTYRVVRISSLDHSYNLGYETHVAGSLISQQAPYERSLSHTKIEAAISLYPQGTEGLRFHRSAIATSP
jgi:hypothetical protein